MLERTRADGRPQSAEYKLASRVEAKIDVTQPQSTFAENFPLRHASRSDVLLSVRSNTSQICQEMTYFGTRPISAQARHAASPGNARCPVQGDYGPRAAPAHRDRRDRHVCYARARADGAQTMIVRVKVTLTDPPRPRYEGMYTRRVLFGSI